MFVLCIDDDEDDCSFLSEALTRAGNALELRFASSGPEAIHCMEQYKQTDDLPALIIIDINMPGMDGLETFHELKKLLTGKYIPVVFLSTSIMHSELSSLEEDHVTVLRKPGSMAGYDSIAETLVQSMLLL